MDDRNKDLTRLFVRDIDEIPLPRRDAWRPARTSASAARVLLSAGAIAAVLAVALVAGYALNQRQQGAAAPSASPTPQDTGLPFVDPRASATPAAPRTPGRPLLSDQFGFLLQVDGGFSIRSETGTTIGQFVGSAPAVSRDGRRIAYWQGSGAGNELRLIDAAKPNDQRTLLTLPATERGGAGILWSPDGAALALPIWSVDSFEGIDGGPKVASLRTISVSGGSSREVARLTSGRVLVPVAWDVDGGVIGAVETGAGGSMSAYDVIPASGTTLGIERQDMQSGLVGVQSSPDGKQVLAVSIYDNTVRIWPTANFSAAYPVRLSTGGLAKLTGARWRPGSDEVWWTRGPEIGRFIPPSGSLAVVYGSAYPATLGPFRPDGSAVVMILTSGSTRSTALVDTRGSGAGEPLGPEPIVASVVLR